MPNAIGQGGFRGRGLPGEQTNTAARWRNVTGMSDARGGNYAIDPNLPQYLRDQFTTEGGSDGTPMVNSMFGNVLRDRNGREVLQLQDDGSLPYSNEGQLIDPSVREFDPDLGWVTPFANFDPSKGRDRRAGNARIAQAAFTAAGGLAGAGALGYGPLAEVGGGLMTAPTAGAIPEMLPATQVGGLAGLGSAGAGAAGAVPPMAELGGVGAAGAGASGGGNLLSQAGSWIANNPGTALRGAAGLAALGAGVSSGNQSANTGGVGDFNDILAAQANANRYDWNTPTGSRRWSQGADGRWTVNDSLSAPEQANFENVQALNAGSTGLARNRLAEIIAAPRRDYYGTLPTSDSYFGRWRG